MSCLEFLIKVGKAISTRNIPDDKNVQSTLLYSGKEWNDQGDISTCLDDKSMNFVEMSMGSKTQKIFRGLCLPSYCNAEWLNRNKEMLATYAQSQNIRITGNSLTFTQYPLNNTHTSSADFILITILISLMLLFILLSYFIPKYIQYKSNRNSKINNGIIINQEDQIISRSSIEQKLIDTKQDIESNQKDEKHHIQKQPDEKLKDSLLLRILDCWNIKANLKRVVTLNANNPDLMCFNCIRVISFLQVILGHEFFIHIQYVSNVKDIPIISKQPFALFIMSCLYSVDVFFFLGGFFVAYVSADPKFLNLFLIKKYIRVASTFFAAILNRIIRILPSYLFALLLFWKYTSFLGNSPTWYEFDDFTQQCDQGWWRKLLFIDNLYDDGQLCFGWGWYLSNDMQMFIFSLILIIVYANNRLYGKISIFLTFAVFQALGIYNSFSNNYLIVSSLTTMPKQDYYFKPWNRSPPYFIGLIFGVLYKEYTSEKSNINKTSFISKIQIVVQNSIILKWALYATGIIIVFSLIFGPRSLQVNGSNYWPAGIQHFWFGTCRTFYVIGIIMILLPGMCGSRDFIYKIMSSSIFQFLAKLSFQGYLVHYIILSYTLWNFKDSIYLNNDNIIQLFFCETIFTLALAFVLVILVETPFNNIANIIFNRKPAPKKLISKEEVKTTNEKKRDNKMNSGINE